MRVSLLSQDLLGRLYSRLLELDVADSLAERFDQLPSLQSLGLQHPLSLSPLIIQHPLSLSPLIIQHPLSLASLIIQPVAQRLDPVAQRLGLPDKGDKAEE